MDMLKKFRENIGLTQSEFARNISVSPSYYIKVELRNKKTE